MNRLLETLGVIGLALTGCGQQHLASPTYRWSNNPNIRNGGVVECAVIPGVEASDTLVLPFGTTVDRLEEGSAPVVVMKKSLSVLGHPSDRISIDEMRNCMGAAFRREDDRVCVGTFGEYSIANHGGASVSLKVRVPPETKVVFDEGLCGGESRATDGSTEDKVAAGWTMLVPQVCGKGAKSEEWSR